MQDSAKKSPSSPKAEETRREDLVSSARQHLKDGGNAAEFATMHGLARSTVAGWCKDHDGPLGRPRKLPPFKELEILELLIESPGVQTWKTIRAAVRQGSTQLVNRRSIFRLLKHWGLSAESAEAGDSMIIHVAVWIHLPETVGKGSSSLQGTIWRLLSCRGMEGFMLTAEDSSAVVVQVAAAMAEKLKSRKREVRTNHPGLAVALREKLKDWQVHLASD